MTEERKKLAKKWEEFFEEQLKEKGYLRTPFVVSFIQEQMLPEIVICAAIKLKDGRIFRGHRHAECLRVAPLINLQIIPRIELIKGRIEGFITSKNRFVDRKEAYKLQIAAGIPSANKSGYSTKWEELFSEDLY